MTIKINQILSLRIETLLANGFSRGEIVDQLRNGTFPREQQIGERTVDFSLLIEFAETNGDACEQAILHGYQVTFHTINGVKSLLSAKFGLQAGQDYQEHEDHLSGIKLSASDVDWLKSVLAMNWQVVEADDAQDAVLKSVKINLAPLE